jgi:hypothetical protein
MKPDIVTFWYGSPLHKMHRMCLRSQLKLGYKITLYSYEPAQGLPDGVANSDAAEILPLSLLERLRPIKRQRHETNRPILHFSDFFRFRLQRLGLGLWLDTDMYLIRPFETDPARPFFAWESKRFLGSAVVYLPPDHPIVDEMERVRTSSDLMPDWLPLHLRARQLMWNTLGIKHGPQDIKTIIYGPLALTELARRHHCLDDALPRESFYHFARGHGFFERSRLADVLDDPQVFGIHVQRKARWDQPPASGSMYEWALRNAGGEMA